MPAPGSALVKPKDEPFGLATIIIGPVSLAALAVVACIAGLVDYIDAGSEVTRLTVNNAVLASSLRASDQRADYWRSVAEHGGIVNCPGAP
jgi:hypothetical protein